MNLLDSEWLEQAMQKRWVLAVSGGRDSMVMLHACVQHLDCENLVICHVNHQLRGVESDADEALVRQVAGDYGIPYEVHHAEVAAVVEEEKKSIELAAREARHQAYSKVCEKHKCDGVLLAHHADDQVETVLYNLLRGSSGLKGMQNEVNLRDKNLNLVRPMLAVRRSEIDDYVTKWQVAYREDASNADPFAVRNRMRNEVLPLLQDVMSRDIGPSVLNSLEHVQQQDSFIDEMVDYLSMLDPQGRLYLPSLREVPDVIQRRIIHRYLTESKISNVSFDLVESALSLLDIENPAKINLPRGMFLRRKEQRIFVSM